MKRTAEEIQAAEDEGYVIAEKEIREKIKRYRALNRRQKAIDAEKKEISNFLKDRMSEMDALYFTDDYGAVMVTRYKTTRNNFDRKRAEKALGAKVIGEFYTQSISEGIRVSS